MPNSTDMAHCLPLPAALSGSGNAATMPLVSLGESYSPDASRGQGSLRTRTLSFARVPFPMQGEPCDTASAARAYGPVAFPQEACPTSCGLRQTPLPCLQALVISRPRTYRLLFTVAVDR